MAEASHRSVLPGEYLGHAIWRLRFAWMFRHDAHTPGQRLTRRIAVRTALDLLRDARARDEGLPVLPGRCGDVGTTESRHLWGPEGPRPDLCGCDACRAEAA